MLYKEKNSLEFNNGCCTRFDGDSLREVRGSGPFDDGHHYGVGDVLQEHLSVEHNPAGVVIPNVDPGVTQTHVVVVQSFVGVLANLH